MSNTTPAQPSLQDRLAQVCAPFRVEVVEGVVSGHKAFNINLSTTFTIGIFAQGASIEEQVVSIITTALRSNPVVKNIIHQSEAHLQRLKNENLRLEDEINEIGKYKIAHDVIANLLGRPTNEEIMP
jgi:hypothetical protein